MFGVSLDKYGKLKEAHNDTVAIVNKHSKELADVLLRVRVLQDKIGTPLETITEEPDFRIEARSLIGAVEKENQDKHTQLKAQLLEAEARIRMNEQTIKELLEQIGKIKSHVGIT